MKEKFRDTDSLYIVTNLKNIDFVQYAEIMLKISRNRKIDEWNGHIV